MPGNIRLPRETLDRLSKIVEPEDYIAEIEAMMGNRRPTVMLNKLLCVVYIENEALGSTGKLYKTTDQIAEDIWQGKPCLVIEAGPAACVDDTMSSFYGQKIQKGDWVTFPIHHCRQIEINKIPCRVVEDRFVDLVMPDPRWITS